MVVCRLSVCRAVAELALFDRIAHLLSPVPRPFDPRMATL